MDNSFKNPTPSGYRDLNVLVELPKSKIIAEVQLHLKEIRKISFGKEHKLYEQRQEIEYLATVENRPLSEIEQGEIERLLLESLNLYKKVWQQYVKQDITV